MNKKLEHHKEYPETVYRDRVYRWFNDNISTMGDAELQKFVDLCMRGNLTFQCADEIDIDDPDISMIDNLLMDIASEKNDELINTYTDEIDWDNDYIEKYNRYSSMDNKLEARITRLERMVNHKNEQLDEMSSDDAMRAFNKESSELVDSANVAIENLNNVKLALIALDKTTEWVDNDLWRNPPEIMKEMAALVSKIEDLNERIQLAAERLGLFRLQ